MDIGKGTHRQDPSARRNANGGTNGADRRPQTTAASLRIVERAPMQYNGGTTHMPQTQHIPHRTPQNNGKKHRERHSPHRSSEKTYKPTSRNPTQQSMQRPHERMEPLATPHGELDSTVPRPHMTCMIPQGNSPAHIPHTEEGGNIFHEDQNP